MRKSLSFFILACVTLILASFYTKWLIKEVRIPLVRPLALIPTEFGEFTGENVSTFSQEFNYSSSDSQISRMYTKKGKTLPINVFLGYWESENETKRISSPRYTKEGWWYYWTKTKTLTTGLGNRMQMKEFLNERGEEKELVYYCYIINGRAVPDEYRFRFLKAVNALLYRKNNAALLWVSVPINTEFPIAQAELYIEDFIKTFQPLLNNYLL